MWTTTGQLARTWHERKAKQTKEILEEIMRENDSHAKNNGSHLELSGLTAPKSVANTTAESKGEDGLKKVIRKRTVSQNSICSTAVPTTKLKVKGIEYENPEEMDKATEIS